MSSEIGVLYCCDVFKLGAKNSDDFKLNHWTIVKKSRFVDLNKITPNSTYWIYRIENEDLNSLNNYMGRFNQ